MFPQQPSAVTQALAVWGGHGEFCAAGGDGDIGGQVIPFPFQAIADDWFAALARRLLGDRLVVKIQKHLALRRDGVVQFKLGVRYVFHRTEAFQMLFSHGGNHAILRADQVTDLLDIPRMPSAHFAQENLMCGRKLFPHCAHYP